MSARASLMLGDGVVARDYWNGYARWRATAFWRGDTDMKTGCGESWVRFGLHGSRSRK